MKNFRGRITRSEGGHFIVDDSDSEMEDEVEPVFTPGNMDIIMNNNLNLIEDDEEDEGSSQYSGDDSPFDEEEGLLVPNEDEEEDVSMEGFFAFGGRPRTRSQDSTSNNDLQASQSQNNQQSGTSQSQDQGPRPSSSGVNRTGGPPERTASPHTLAIGDGMQNPDINTLIFDRPISSEGFTSIINFRHQRSPNIEDDENSLDNEEEDGQQDSGDQHEQSTTPEYQNGLRSSPRYFPDSPEPSSRNSAMSAHFSNSSNASDNSPHEGDYVPLPLPFDGEYVLETSPLPLFDDDEEKEIKEETTHKQEEQKDLKIETEVTKDTKDAIEIEQHTDPSSTPVSNSSPTHDEGSQSGRNKLKCTEDGGDCINPMVSDVEELDENDDALRGDRIGSTTYSERHVLKILIKWVQELPKYSADSIKADIEHGETDGPSLLDKNRFLENDFEEEMALLWDMSFEPDVMTFLVENNVFNIIRQTLDESSCARLTEIGLGIMANILSQQSIVEDFSIHDTNLGLVETVISQPGKMASVPVLIQVFAVLRRITWFLRNVALVQKWMDLLLSQEFLSCANFIMSSCTNVLLLGNVIITLFTVLEILGPDSAEDQKTEKDEEEAAGDEKKESSCNYFGKALAEPTKKEKDFEGHHPFCETGFVSSLGEGLKELMKDPKPRKTRKLTSTRDGGFGAGPGEEVGTVDRDLNNMEMPIPDGLIQNAILNGLSCFYFLHKTSNGKESLRKSLNQVINFILEFFRKFSLCTDSIGNSSGLDYFALGVNLLTFCQKELGEIVQEILVVPVTTAAKLVEEYDQQDDELTLYQMQKKKQNKDGEIEEHDGPTFIALVIHEYLASLADAFGPEEVFSVKGKNPKFFKLVDNLVIKVSEENQQCTEEIS